MSMQVVWGYCPLCGAEAGEYCRTVAEGQHFVAVRDGALKWAGKQYTERDSKGGWVVHDDYREPLDPLRAAIQRVLTRD